MKQSLHGIVRNNFPMGPGQPSSPLIPAQLCRRLCSILYPQLPAYLESWPPAERLYTASQLSPLNREVSQDSCSSCCLSLQTSPYFPPAASEAE